MDKPGVEASLIGAAKVLNPMEIHPPGKPARTAKDFFAHIAVITTGILIALSFEAALEWNHHRQLVREAKENITHEIEDNKKAVEASFKGIEERRAKIGIAIQFAEDILRTGKTPIREMTLDYAAPAITAAAWETAQATGALGHMKYADVKKYAAVYQVQRLYTSSQQGRVEKLTQAISVVMSGDPAKARSKDIELFRERVMSLVGDAEMEKDLAESLIHAYDTVLKPD